jgi:hypothetical protein
MQCSSECFEVTFCVALPEVDGEFLTPRANLIDKCQRVGTVGSTEAFKDVRREMLDKVTAFKSALVCGSSVVWRLVDFLSGRVEQ